jgi:hypothetical protein
MDDFIHIMMKSALLRARLFARDTEGAVSRRVLRGNR